MEQKRTLLNESHFFYKSVRERRVTGVKAVAINLSLRFAALMMCPGDDIAMIAASSSNALDAHNENPAAILYRRPKVPEPKLIYKGNV